jgi:methionine-rich copper-binding protein CopC
MITSVIRRRFRATVFVSLGLVALLVSPVAVLAHAELETVDPADGATVTVAPTEIVMTFSEALDPAKSSIVVALIGGDEVASGGIVDPAEPTRMTLAIPELTAGEYELRWTSASAVDGDLDRGTTMFSYAPPPPTPNPTASATPSASPTPPASPASSTSPSPSPSPSAGGTATSSTDVIVPIVAAIVVLAVLGGWLLSRSRGRGPA